MVGHRKSIVLKEVWFYFQSTFFKLRRVILDFCCSLITLPLLLEKEEWYSGLLSWGWWNSGGTTLGAVLGVVVQIFPSFFPFTLTLPIPGKEPKKKKKRFTLKRLNILCNDEGLLGWHYLPKMMSTALTSQMPLLNFSSNMKIALSNSKNNCQFLPLHKKEKEKKKRLWGKKKNSETWLSK